MPVVLSIPLRRYYSMPKRGAVKMNSTRLNKHDTTSLGTYAVPSAALYVLATLTNGSKLALTPRHLYRWTKDGLAGGYLTGIRNRHLFINYRDLISLRAIAAMRGKGMHHRDIVTAEHVLREYFKCDYPFATLTFWTAPPKDIFVKETGVLLSASRYLQTAMDFFEEYMQPHHNMTFDMFGLSSSWRVRTNVLLNPEIQYGEPCIEGTRVPTQVIYSFNRAGDDPEVLAHFYGIQRSRIKDAIAWEKRLQRVGYNRKK